MKVSIVIPVYNEARHLADCLEAIGRQTVEPFEVIVVDNNSTDETVAVASRFPFVTVLRETRQGVVYARDRGFNAARGDIIGRLDADSIIAPDWIAMLVCIYKENDALAAVTGSVRYYGLALRDLIDTIDLYIRRRLARLLGHEVALQGANMAIRRESWLQIRRQVCRRGHLHEDHDLGIHLAQTGHLVVFDERLVAAIDSRRAESSWWDFCKYAWLSPHTYSQHGLTSQRHMYPVVALAITCYLPLNVLRRGFDAEAQRFSWRQTFTQSVPARANPATFVE